jgi:hypothetical protein
MRIVTAKNIAEQTLSLYAKTPNAPTSHLAKGMDTRFLGPSVTTTRNGTLKGPRYKRWGARNEAEAVAGRGDLTASERDSMTVGRDQNSLQLPIAAAESGVRRGEGTVCSDVLRGVQARRFKS